MSTLTDAEMDRIKYECLDNVLGFGAVPYISIKNVYGIIRDNVTGSSTPPTSSSTAVTAAGPVTLTLASVTGLAVGTRVVLDVDQAREVVTVRNVTGLTISVICAKLHSGTYPVEIESALTIVRGILTDLTQLEIATRNAFSKAGIKQVDEIVFFGDGDSKTVADSVADQRTNMRFELARACGIEWIVRAALARRAGGSFEVY